MLRLAASIFVKLEGMPEYRPGRCYHVIYHNNFRRQN